MISSLFKFGILLAIFLVLFERLLKEDTLLRFTQSTIKQSQINLKEQTTLLDDKGQVKFFGYGIDQDKYVTLNYENAVTPWLNKDWSFIKMRSYNFIMIYTPDHVL